MNDGMSTGLDRLKGLLSWWGFPANDFSNDIPPLAAISDAIAKLQRGYFDTFSRNMDAMFAVNDRVSRAAKDLFYAKTMADLSLVQDEIFNALSEAASSHSNTWNEFRRLLIEALGERGNQASTEGEKRSIPITVTPIGKPEAVAKETKAPRETVSASASPKGSK